MGETKRKTYRCEKCNVLITDPRLYGIIPYNENNTKIPKRKNIKNHDIAMYCDGCKHYTIIYDAEEQEYRDFIQYFKMGIEHEWKHCE